MDSVGADFKGARQAPGFSIAPDDCTEFGQIHSAYRLELSPLELRIENGSRQTVIPNQSLQPFGPCAAVREADEPLARPFQ
jgi:hypothetical protein